MTDQNRHLKIVVYEPGGRNKIGIFQVWWLMIKNIADSRELIYVLFKRDFFASYKKSAFGITWILLSPILAIMSWVFMNATGILNPGDVGIPYPAYVLLSTSIWGIFSGAYTAAQGTLKAGEGIISQVKYPHDVLLVKQIAHHLATFSIGFAVNIVVLFSFGVVPSWKAVLFPAVILPLVFLGAAIGLVVSVFGVVAVEIQRAADLFVGILIWVTPVIYSSKVTHPLLQTVMTWNPLTYLVSAARDMVLYGRIENDLYFLLSSAISLCLFLIAWKLFFVTEERVVEKML